MIKSVFILANKKIPDIEEKLSLVEEVLKTCGKTVEKSLQNVDLIITMGGDGTFLQGTRLLNNRTLIYGIKYGKVGFLTNNPSNIESKIAKIVSGKYNIVERSMLEAKVVRDKKIIFKDTCLNEILITKQHIRIIDIYLKGRKEILFQTRGDGVIISTPTGCTAHALSAMGPIVEPSIKCFIIIPICPHTLSWRPVIINDNEEISADISQDAILVIDGQREFVLEEKDIVVIKKSPKIARTIMDEESLFKTLQSKFSWNI